MKLLHGDCLEIMRTIPDKSVDFILCDPPYGSTNLKWDCVIDFSKMWQQLNRIAKPGAAIVLFGSEPFSSLLRVSNLKNFKYDWLWDKKSAGNFMVAKYQPLKTFENISVFGVGDKVRYFPQLRGGFENRTHEKPNAKKSDLLKGIKSGAFYKTEKNKPGSTRYPKALIELSKQSTECRNATALHPTQKPVELLEYLIQTYTLPGETVLDFTMGVGSTGVAAVNAGRDFIGIELDKKYFDIARERIAAAENGKRENMALCG